MLDAGLCARCRHARTIVNRRGSAFLFCRRASDDARFPRYPVLPVIRCSGYEPESTGRTPTTSTEGS